MNQKRRLSGILAIAALLLFPSISRGQELSLTLRTVPISKAITEVQKVSGYSIVVKSDGLDLSKTVSVQFENEDIRTAIRKIFEGQPVEVAVSSKNISVSIRELQAPPHNRLNSLR